MYGVMCGAMYGVMYGVAAVALLSGLVSSSCPSEFLTCPPEVILTSPEDQVILTCNTVKEASHCEWITPFNRDGIQVISDDPNYPRLDPESNTHSCSIKINSVEAKDLGNWTCTATAKGEQKKAHSSPAQVVVATTPSHPYIVVNGIKNPKVVNITENSPVHVACVVDVSRPAPGFYWYVAKNDPTSGNFEKNLTKYSTINKYSIKAADNQVLYKSVSNLKLNLDYKMNRKYLWCNITHTTLEPGDHFYTHTKLNISYSPRFQNLTSKFEFTVDTQAKFKLRFLSNPSPHNDADVKLLIGGRDSVASRSSSSDGTIHVGVPHPVEGVPDTYDIEITFDKITLEQTKSNYRLSVSNQVEDPSLHKVVLVVVGSGKKDSNIGVIIGIVLLVSILLIAAGVTYYAYKKSKFCFAPSEHKSVPVEAPPANIAHRPSRRTKEMREVTLFTRNSREEEMGRHSGQGHPVPLPRA